MPVPRVSEIDNPSSELLGGAEELDPVSATTSTTQREASQQPDAGAVGVSTGIEDEFDAVLNLESNFQAEGFREASSAGAAAGLSEGRTLGWKAGVALTTELEFYHGAASALLALSKAFEERVPARSIPVATRLVEMCREHSLAERGNDQDLDMDAVASSARGLFRQMVAFAGLSGLRFDLGSRSLMADLSF